MDRRKDNETRGSVEHTLQRRDIEILTEKVEEGFVGVHARQDEANSKTAKNVLDIAELKNDMTFYKGGLAVLTILFVPVLLYIITKTL